LTARGIISTSGLTYSYLYLDNVTANAANRNWALIQNVNAYGDLGINQSNAQNGNPITAGTTKLYISPSGNIGINTNSPTEIIQANGSIRALGILNTDICQVITDSSNSTSYRAALATFGNTAVGDLLGIGRAANSFLYKNGGTLVIGTGAAFPLIFSTNDAERMRLTSTNGGQLSVGGSTNTFIDYSGSVARFYGGSGTNTFGLGAASAIYYQGDNSQFYPTADNTRSIGLGSNRYTAIWAVNGTIQTSDKREKTDIVNSDLGLDFVTKLRPVSYKWKVGQNNQTTETKIDEEGNEITEFIITPRPGIRTHYGLIAQEVEELLNGKDFAGFIHDKESDVKGLRYDQFIPLLIKSIQEQQAQIEELKTLINK
jgi:hypothetical protein